MSSADSTFAQVHSSWSIYSTTLTHSITSFVGSIEEVEGSLGQYFRCSENIKEIDEKDLMGMVSSKIRSFVRKGLLSNEQGMVAARHFDAKHFGIEVDMWLIFENAEKVDYIKSLCRVKEGAHQLMPTRECQGRSSRSI
ncbi:uncharacterized protein LOC123892805 isoform X1 [Trifolium pratense]|uniref:Uncharacterized protein n=1 Tax=Trifolium pratense TaxID=57577 RepID=A0ACB0LRV4_TRIPR|nr:uncharacterized protein LOC123892805 isoform X1 [Trifolium pratense]CAJ2671088.1 unnamed protein product [Trifolium pratense]